MNPEDVGGKDIVDNIRSDIEKLFENVQTINMICYCQQLLTEYNSNSVQNKYNCHVCHKSLGFKSYDCNNRSCIYKRISGKTFCSCPSCYEQGAYATLNHTKEEWKQIFVSKLRSSITAMSYVAVHIHCAFRLC